MLKATGITVTSGYRLCSRCMMACKIIDTANSILMEISNMHDSDGSNICATESGASRSDFKMELQYQKHHDSSTLNKTKLNLNISLNLFDESPLRFHDVPN